MRNTINAGRGGEWQTTDSELYRLDKIFLRRLLARLAVVLDALVILPTLVGVGLGPAVLCLVGTLYAVVNRRKKVVPAWLIVGGLWGLLVTLLWTGELLGYNTWPGLVRYYLANHKVYWTFNLLLFNVNHPLPTYGLALRLAGILVGTWGLYTPLKSIEWAWMLETEAAQVRNAAPRPLSIDATTPGGVHLKSGESPTEAPVVGGIAKIARRERGEIVL